MAGYWPSSLFVFLATLREVKLHQRKGLRMTQRLHHPVLPSSPTLKQMFCRRMSNVIEFLIFFRF